MTTKVLIVNYGPHAIKVSINDGGGDVFKHIYPQNSAEFYVYSTQSLEVTEVERNNQADNPQTSFDLEERN